MPLPVSLARPLAVSIVLGAAGARLAAAEEPVPAPAFSDSAAALGDPPAGDSATAGPLLSRVAAGIQTGSDDAPVDTGRVVRPRAVEYSEGYGKRLEIHRIARGQRGGGRGRHAQGGQGPGRLGRGDAEGLNDRDPRRRKSWQS